MRNRTLVIALAAAALTSTSAPSFGQTVSEPTASAGELLEEPGFVMDDLAIPEGFTAENISGYYLIHDHATDTWTAEFVFESDFSESGYAGDSGPEDSGGGLTGRTISGGGYANGGSVLDDGVMLGAASRSPPAEPR